jgi:hypothetical protein
MRHRRRTDAAQSSQRLRWRMSYRFSMKAAAEGRHFVFDVAHVRRQRTRKASLDEPFGAVTSGDASNSAALIHSIEQPVILRRKPAGRWTLAEFRKLSP